MLGVAAASSQVLLWDGGSGCSWEVGISWDKTSQRLVKVSELVAGWRAVGWVAACAPASSPASTVL